MHTLTTSCSNGCSTNKRTSRKLFIRLGASWTVLSPMTFKSAWTKRSLSCVLWVQRLGASSSTTSSIINVKNGLQFNGNVGPHGLELWTNTHLGAQISFGAFESQTLRRRVSVGTPAYKRLRPWFTGKHNHPATVRAQLWAASIRASYCHGLARTASSSLSTECMLT